VICPKCGFDQPDDAYCAFCGISIKKYRQERRKKLYFLYALGVCVIVAGGLIVFRSGRRLETAEPVVPYATEETENRTRAVDVAESRQARFEPKQESSNEKTAGDSWQEASQQEALFQSEDLEDRTASTPRTSEQLSLTEPAVGSAPEADGGEEVTARDWFEKGRALDDESESEVEFYEKALEVDPEFAPAYYRLGAIQFRRARFELADRQFAKFIEHASEAERQAYDIYVYYSPSDVERITAPSAAEEASGEEEAKETSRTALEAENEVSAEIEGGEKKETPSEVEETDEGPEDAGEDRAEEVGSAEDTAGKAPEETEEVEIETTAEGTNEPEEGGY
jgi:tetratricopeptide (TPR) repeat protein